MVLEAVICLALWTGIDVSNLAGFKQIFLSRSILREETITVDCA